MEEKSMRDMYKLGLGEEVANCVTHGIMALLCLIALPAAAVYSYELGGTLRSTGVSIFIVCLFLMFIVSTLYHCMPFGSDHKYVFRKLDHICIYFAIAGSYTPIALCVIGGWECIAILCIEWCAVIGGVLLSIILKILSEIVYDDLYDYGMDSTLIYACNHPECNATLSRVDRSWRYHVYHWRLLLWQTTT